MTGLILGSGSPRRLELLALLGLTPDAIRAPDVDETPLKAELPRVYCERITRAKLEAVHRTAGEVVLCADTTVALGRRILGKAADEAEAEQFLRLLSGRRHSVITCVGVASDQGVAFKTNVTAVKMKRLDEMELKAYLKSRDWEGKAGAYGIQGAAGAFIPWISGSFTGVVGLPLSETANLLRNAGLNIGWGA